MASENQGAGILMKFETRSNRVKGLSFHPKRPWILATLHTGVIQLWDFRMNTLIDRYEEHVGPVRGVDFHSHQPLFVSGGDDYDIKVWNYKLKRCLFTLSGHMDYVRTVQFHLSEPWILSASDDQTIRIWNWQGRSCMSSLTGHNNYVMSAFFHPRKDLVVSASLDHMIRIWDLYGLKARRTNNSNYPGQEIFGNNDVQVKFILEGHERPVNYASFHPTKNLVVSGSDDNSVKVWRIDEDRVYEVNTCNKHVSNVTCVMYFKDYIISNSEDGSIYVFDTKTSTYTQTCHRSDRFWVLAVQPERNLIAAGHDNGMIIFKLERERPAMHLVDNTNLFWVATSPSGERQIQTYDFSKAGGIQSTVCALPGKHTHSPRSICYNRDEDKFLVYYADSASYDLVVKGDRFQQGYCTTPVWFSRNKFAGLNSAKSIIVTNSQNTTVASLDPVGSGDEIFWAPQGTILLRGEEELYLYDPQHKRVTGKAPVAKCKSVVWSSDFSKLAAVSKRSIVVLSKKGLKHVCTVHENSAIIKSACFDEGPAATTLIYCTHNHLKYCLMNGDTGTIKTLSSPLYLVKVVNDEVAYIDREGNLTTNMKIDTSELRFKLALLGEKWGDLLKIVSKTKAHGQALVSYLQQRGFHEVAMCFVKDVKIKFDLAIQCGDLKEAQGCAEQINEESCWTRLAESAMNYGKVEMATAALSKTGSAAAHQKLSFEHFVLGNDEKCRDFADMQRADLGFRFQMATLTGDFESRIKLLEEAGQFTLAHQVAIRHGLTEKASSLLKAAGKSIMDAMSMPAADDEEEEELEDLVATRNRMAMRAKEKAFEVTNRMAEMSGTPLPMLKKTPIATDWPMTRISESHVMMALKKGVNVEHNDADEDVAVGGAWDVGGLDDDLEEPKQDGWGEEGAVDDLDMDGDDMGGGWAVQDDLIGLDAEDLMVGKGDKDIQMPNPGRPTTRLWVDGSRHACDHAAAGNFESAMRLLKTHYGILDFAPLKPYFLQCYAAANGSMPVSTALPPHVAYQSTPDRLPIRSLFLSTLQEKCKQGNTFTTYGKFADAKNTFQQVLQMAVLLVASASDILEKNDLIKKARNYASAFSLQLARAEFESKPARSAEMAAYFTHYDLDPGHMGLVLKFAMHETWKRQFVRTSGAIARRLLDYNPEAKVAAQAKKVMMTAETKDDAAKLDYDSRNPFEVCVKTWVPMYLGSTNPIRCSYCGAPALPKFS
eukprot:gene21672-33360_t